MAEKLIQLNIPYYFTLHDHHSVILHDNFLINKKAINNAERAFVPAKYLVKFFDNVPFYLSHGVDLNVYYNKENTENFNNDLKLLCVGNNMYSHTDKHDRKGFGLAIRAASELNIPITIAGPFNDVKSNKQFFDFNPELLEYNKLNIIKNPTENELIDLYNTHDILYILLN